MVALLPLATLHTACRTDQRTNTAGADTLQESSVWVGAPVHQIPYYSRPDGKLIFYGHELIANTARYLGPQGSVLQISNGMNCQNCHLDAGTKPWGNNYGAVYTTYPKFRDRSGAVETVYKRVNDCFERSLNGSALETQSMALIAIYACSK